jgi:hypothetical protein
MTCVSVAAIIKQSSDIIISSSSNSSSSSSSRGPAHAADDPSLPASALSSKLFELLGVEPTTVRFAASRIQLAELQGLDVMHVAELFEDALRLPVSDVECGRTPWVRFVLGLGFREMLGYNGRAELPGASSTQVV